MQVFLQGSSANEISELVKDHGGTVTHSLHIIDAVGAKLTGPQLTEVLESPLVSRFIDDLADSAVPGKPEDEEDAPPCRVRGHIELDFKPDSIGWKLYNKYEKPAALSSLTLDWPDSLGSIKSLRIGKTLIDPSRYSNIQDTALTLEFEGKDQPVIAGMEQLDLAFSNHPADPADAPPQRDFTMEASFVGPCSTKLVPGYENNHEDYYYNTAGGVDELHKQGLTGKGVTVAIIDSGLWEHELLRNDTQGNNRLLATYNAITDTEGGEVLDESGHGTHMASIIANSGKTLKNGEWTGTYKGVAPDANLVAVKVLDRQGLAHLLDIVRAVQWVVDNKLKYDISILNLSFSKNSRWQFWEDPVNQATLRAWRRGIAIVAAAGNTGPKPNSIGSPGNVPEIITVGAITDAWSALNIEDDYLPDFSSRGATSSGYVKPDIVALGGHITGLVSPQSHLALQQPEDILKSGEYVSTGTSQSSAFVTGISAMISEFYNDIAPDELKCILVSTANPAIDLSGELFYGPFDQGAGLVSLPRALMFGPKCLTAPRRVATSYKWPFFSYLPIGLSNRSAESNSEVSFSDKRPEEKNPKNRRWGLKDHVERLNPEIPGTEKNRGWQEIYQIEKELIKEMSQNLGAQPGDQLSD